MSLDLPYRRLLLAIAAVAVSTLPVFLAGASFVQLESDIGLTTTTLGVATASFFLAAAATSAPLGRLVERIGWRAALRWNATISGAILLAIALLVRSPLTLSLLLIVAGTVYGFTNPAANKAIAERVDPGRRALVFGLKHGAIPASTMLAGLAVPLLIVTVGWRATYAVAALLAPVVWLLIRRLPRAIPEVAGANSSGRGIRPLSGRTLAMLALAGTLATGAAVSLGTFLVAAAVDRSFTESQGGLLLFAGSVASIAARIAAGAFTDARRGYGFTGAAALMGCGAAVFLLMPSSAGFGFAVLVLAAFATGWGWPGLTTFAVVNANAGSAAASSAVTQSGVFLGAGVAPVVLGWVIDRRSFDASWILVAFLLLAAASVVAVVGARAAATRTTEPV